MYKIINIRNYTCIYIYIYICLLLFGRIILIGVSWSTLVAALGWRCLSNATCPIRPHVFSTALLV